MKKKAMIIATVYSFVSHFEKNDIKILQELGYEIVVASSYEGYKGELEDLNIEKLDIPFTRSPISLKNIKAFFKLNKYLKENQVDLIHCHTPVGGVVGRMIGRWNKVSRIIYTAHGFHFFDGGPKINWLIYYPIEKILSKFTDTLITINKEDYERAKTFYAKRVEYVPGVGVDVDKIQSIKVDKEQKRKELGLSMDDIVLLSVGELNDNKNHITPIKALAEIKNKNIKYLIAGKGPLENHLKEEIKKLGLEDLVKLLGYRKDIYELNKISDIFIFPSKREGLSVALMEALVCGLPVICSNIRGNRDFFIGQDNYKLINNEIESYHKIILDIVKNIPLNLKIDSILSKINIFSIKNQMKKIYLKK
nr:glycosyltransferase family 4 protein [uncultured Fusobacterium sp.]